MKNHLKRIAAPRTWQLDRKATKFTLRPNSGGQSLDMGFALGTLLRDHLQIASTMNEVQKILNANEIIVDGKRKKDRRTMVGLFDIISIPTTKQHVQVVLDSKGRLTTKEIDEKNITIKECKVTGKTILRGGKIQLNLYDGKNIITDTKDVRVGDSVIISMPKYTVTQVLPLKIGAHVFLTQGKHAGSSGVLKELEGETARYELANKTIIETTKKYIFVVSK